MAKAPAQVSRDRSGLGSSTSQASTIGTPPMISCQPVSAMIPIGQLWPFMRDDPAGPADGGADHQERAKRAAAEADQLRADQERRCPAMPSARAAMRRRLSRSFRYQALNSAAQIGMV